MNCGRKGSINPKYWKTSVGITLTSHGPFHRGGSPASLRFHLILKIWLPHMVVMVEKGVYGASLV
jgi:hypothetical protein